jgi:protease I
MEGFKKKKILFLVGDFVEDYEAMVPYQMCLMVGHEPHTVCPDKKKGDNVKTAVHEFEGDQTYSEKRGHNFAITHAFADINPEDYDALVIPGGRSPEYLRLNPRVIEVTKHFLEKNKPLAVICHGIQILTATGAIKGRTMTCYPAVSPEVELAGATYKKVEIDEAVVDGNLVTSPAWPGHPKWMAKFFEVLGTTFSSK